MMTPREAKLVFIKTKKTAGSSIEMALSQKLQDGDFATPFGKEAELQRPGKQYIVRRSVRLLRDRAQGEVQARYPHNGISVVNRFLSDIAEGCSSICVERNPWDKAVSALHFWLHQRGRQINDAHVMFLSFCKTRLKYFSDFDLYSESGDIVVDRVLRYENLNSELAQVLDDFGLSDVNLGDRRWNSGIRKTRQFDLFYGDNWDGEAVDLVADLFRREIDAFGYELPNTEQPEATRSTAR